MAGLLPGQGVFFPGVRVFSLPLRFFLRGRLFWIARRLAMGVGAFGRGRAQYMRFSHMGQARLYLVCDSGRRREMATGPVEVEP